MNKIRLYTRFCLRSLLTVLFVLQAGSVFSQSGCVFQLEQQSVVSSTCAANGKITVALTGADVGSLTNVLYSLESISFTGISLAPVTSPLFENLPPGTYRAKATATCGETEVSRTVDVTVTGNYVAFSAAVVAKRSALFQCNTGTAQVTFQNGKPPYKITLSNTPAGYSGPAVVQINTTGYLLENLNGGSYTVTMMDSCQSTASVQTIVIPELRAFNSGDFYSRQQAISNVFDCKSFTTTVIRLFSGSIFKEYEQSSGVLRFSVSLDGGPRGPEKPWPANLDTIHLPAGKTFKDVWNKNLTFYLKTPCGTEYPIVQSIFSPYTPVTPTMNCQTDFNADFTINNTNVICYPLISKITNTGTGQTWSDTIPDQNAPAQRSIPNLPFGNYQIISNAADGGVVGPYTFNVPPPSGEPYFVEVQNNGGAGGNHRAAMFYVRKRTGNYTVGTRVELLSAPGNGTYNRLIDANMSPSSILFVSQSSTPPFGFFYPGVYYWRITDACGVYDIPVTVEEHHVYNYNWSYTEQQSCNGLKIIPTGEVWYNRVRVPGYFAILLGPQGNTGYNSAVVPNGSPLYLPIDGTYKVGMSANANSVGNFGLEPTVKSISYTFKPLQVDIPRSGGWVCPGQPANSGALTVVGKDGIPTAEGRYTYKLAQAGYGATGPYLDSNSTGKFTPYASGGGYSLTANTNYDVKVIDSCNASVVQTFKILDYATAQMAYTNRPDFCIGDMIRFSVINLPASAVSYTWTGPNRFRSFSQHAILRNARARNAGEYYVTISADICNQLIYDTITVKVAPYVESCFSAITDTTVNPVAQGLQGNWHPYRSYVYYGARAESDPTQPTNIRKDGTFKDFIPFWTFQQNAWKAATDTTRWTWNQESTLFNKKGFELENRDPLGRYNTAVYGYANTLPVAMVQNARYREAAFEGFEDYAMESKDCETPCATDRRFDFSPHLAKIDSTERHTGQYSLKIMPGEKVGIVSMVTDTAALFTQPVFIMGVNVCTPGSVLKKVSANSASIIPSFSPLGGKKVLVSAWVKEGRDCKCMHYDQNQISIAVNGSSDSVVITARPAGPIIDGWQRYEQVVNLPVGTRKFSLVFSATGTSPVYFDDVRVHPFHANMKSYVYHASNLRLMAELDENNYATFYEYDDDGSLMRVKKETERGVMTIKETRSSQVNE